MFSGICPRGSNSAPGRGNTGITSGRSAGPRYCAFIGIASLRPPPQRHARGGGHPALDRPPSRTMTSEKSRKQNRRQFLAALDRRRIGKAPGFEELDELLARAVVVPFAVAPDDLEQMLRGVLALAFGIQRDREIE